MLKQERLIGLDILRCVLMLIGPIYHISNLYTEESNTISVNNRTLYDFFSIFHAFRMEMFFLLSGFFATYLIEKKGLHLFKKSRIDKIYIPLLFSLIIIWPITLQTDNYLSNTSLISFNHIWFLVSLSLISIIYYYYDNLRKIIFKIIKYNLFTIIFLIPILAISAMTINHIIKTLLKSIHNFEIYIFLYEIFFFIIH